MAHSSAEACLSPKQYVPPSGLPHCISSTWRSPVSVLRYGHGGEDQADETENEQVQTGSRLRLETGAGLPQGKHMFRYSGCMLRYSRFTEKENMCLQYTVCMVALCIGHMAPFASSQACTHAYINIILRMCIDICTVYILYTHRVTQTYPNR